MKVWKGFIRRNKGWLGLFTGMTASHLFYLYLMRAPKADLVYSTCIDVGIFLVIFLVMWITYQKKVQRLRQFLSCPLENNMQLPEAEEPLEEFYTELFSRANEERAEAMRRAGREKQEQREYYARWVHQIKTPIAAMQLLLQTQREEAPERYKEQEEIEEIVQETMMWLWENRCTLMEELTLKTLLFTIVKNKALNRLSHFEIKRKVHQEIVDKYDSEFNNPDFYLSDELFRLYEEALKKLPKEYLEAYEMNRNQHLTHKEIAEKLNVSPQTINYRIGQALKLLRVALKDYLPLFILIFGPNFFEQS